MYWHRGRELEARYPQETELQMDQSHFARYDAFKYQKPLRDYPLYLHVGRQLDAPFPRRRCSKWIKAISARYDAIKHLNSKWTLRIASIQVMRTGVIDQ